MDINLIGISGRIGSGKDTFAKMVQLALYNNIFEKRGAEHFVPSTQEVLDNLSKSWNYTNGVWQIKKFATPLKQIACILIGCTMEQLEDQEFKKSTLGQEWWQPSYRRDTPYPYKPTVRELLQRLATEAIRDQIHDNTWINAMFNEYKISLVNKTSKEEYKYLGKHKSNIDYEAKFPKWLITDVRFSNEAKAIKDRGGILIRISRGNPEHWRDDKTLHSSETALDSYKDWNWYVKNTSTLEDLYENAKTFVNEYKLS